MKRPRHVLSIAVLLGFGPWLAGRDAFAAEAAAPSPYRVITLADIEDKSYPNPSKKVIEAIEQAAPAAAPAKPARPRKVLIFGRTSHHPPVPACFVAIDAMGRKTAAFTTVWTADEKAFLSENLREFDAVVLNNVHVANPMLPEDFESLQGKERLEAREREAACEKSLMAFVAEGKGVVGIHSSAAMGLRWQECVDMIGGSYAGYHAHGDYVVRVVEPDHPLCRDVAPSFAIKDEVYAFRLPTPQVPNQPFSRDRVRVLLELDRSKVTAEQEADVKPKGQDYDYAVSWVKPHGKGRVFYSSLGHFPQNYVNPQAMKHWLAGIQYAIGDLEAPAETPAEAARTRAVEQLTSPDEAARIEALRSLARVGTVTDVPALVTLVQTAASDAEKQAAAVALASLSGDEVDAMLFRMLETADPKTRGVLLRGIYARQVPAYGSRYPSGRQVVSSLIGLLAKAAPAERSGLGVAVREASRRYPEQEHTAALLALLDSGDVETKRIVLPIVGERGTPEALAAIRAARSDPDESVRQAAIVGLCSWPDSEVAAELLAIAKEPAKPEHRMMAVRALARVMPRAAGDKPRESVQMLESSLTLADRPGDKQAVLSGLAAVRSPEALAVAVAATADEEVRLQAIQAVLQIAQPLWKTHEPVVREALEKIKPLATDPAVRQRIDGIMGIPQPPPKPKAAAAAGLRPQRVPRRRRAAVLRGPAGDGPHSRAFATTWSGDAAVLLPRDSRTDRAMPGC